VRAGSLRRRVTIQERSASFDTFGEPLDTWTTFATVWAEIVDLSSTEIVRDGSFSAQITTTVTIRYRTGILSGMRVVDGTRTFEIVGPPIDREGRVRKLELPVKEIGP
jgi:SPP1 family predicted phage head-tail adaptor